MFQPVPLNITGPTYQSRSRPLSSQETLNLYQEINEGGEEQYVLMPWAGQTLLSEVDGIDRGLTAMSGVLYRVVGQSFYKVVNNNHFLLGVISGTGRCTFANDGTNLFIASGDNVHWYNGTDVQLVTDPDIVGAKTVDVINSQFIYTKEKITVLSSVGDGSTADGLDAVGAESDPDNLVRDFVFNEEVLRFGELTLERWYNTGTGRPPIQRLQGQTQQVGLGARYSVAKTERAYYFLGDDRQVYQGQQGNAISITPPAIANTLESFDDVSSAVGYTVMIQGQYFYILTIKNKTLAVNEALGANGWFSLSDDLEGGKYNLTSALYFKGKNYVCDGGKLLCLDVNEPTHNTKKVRRRRVTQSINADIFNKKGYRLQMKRFELIAEMGVGQITGFDDPKIQLETSVDGGKSWKHETWMTLGRLGQTSARAEWNSNKTFYDMMIRLTFTEPVQIFLRSAVIELRLAGR